MLDSIGTEPLTGVRVSVTGPCALGADPLDVIAPGRTEVTSLFLMRDADGGLCVVDIASNDGEHPHYLVTMKVPAVGTRGGCSATGGAGVWTLAVMLVALGLRGRVAGRRGAARVAERRAPGG